MVGAEQTAPERPFVKLATQSVAEVAALCALSDPAKALIPQFPAPGPFLQALSGGDVNALIDGVRWLAHGLMKREAVWWACLAGRLGVTLKGEAAITPPDMAALVAAETWVFKPTEENRRAAWAKAQATEFASPQAWAAVAAFWSGGSMSPPDLPAVPPPDFACGRAVSGAVMIAAVTNPEAHLDNYRKLLAAGIDIAAGGNGRAALG
ncbi:MAG: hypothetical protein IT557_20005 [Alphaproteobacteria bacterium]|nr:hypothetical protein [Alphaproteobacteria bacterium]